MPAQGKTIIITGAAGGLGKTIAASYLTSGANVAICDINPVRLEETSTEWTQKYDSSKFLTAKVNIAEEKQVEEFFENVRQRFGRVDVLVNNAGVMDKFDGAGTAELELWNRVIGVNLTGAFLCTKAAVNIFLSQAESQSQSQAQGEGKGKGEGEGSGGIILSIGSVASIRGLNAGAAYVASKHGLLGLMRNTAGTYGHKGISAITFLMGAMETNIMDSFQNGYHEENMANMMTKYPGFEPGVTNVKLEDVAKYCLFYSDPAIAQASNGSAVTINKNWPVM
ncbi:NAD(P)-binding protein [Poronia punctata]|nr:NAD(P)-binding protein [Poronia punctata]